MGNVNFLRFDSADALALAAASQWLQSVPAGAPHFAAFSGGRIAATFFDAITQEVPRRKTDLSQVHFFWADERCVPPEDPQSNYHLMRMHMFEPLKVPPAQVHRIPGELGPMIAARDASAEYQRVAQPVLDIVFLGMGEDGHIASIFPGDPLGESPAQPYRPVTHAPKPPPERVTLAMHAMVAARQVWVLASGPGKERALGESLKAEGRTPLARLLQRRDFTHVFSDIPPK